MAVVLPHGPSSGAGSQVVRSPCAALLDALELPRLMTPAAGFSTPIQTPPPSAAHYSPPTPRVSFSAISQPSPTTQDSVSINPESPSKSSKPPCCRRLMQRFAEEPTFRPKLNETSLKLVSRLPRSTRPVVTRLSESRKNKKACCKPDHTFSPKLNALSLKLAQERAGRQEEVEARAAELAAARLNEFYSEYTFRPKVSERSMKIADSLGVGFLTRQEMYIQKRQKLIEEAYQQTTPPRPSILLRRPHPLNSQQQQQENKAHESRASSICDSSAESSPELKEKQRLTPPKLSRRFRPRSHTAPSLSLTTTAQNEVSTTPQTSPKQERRRKRKITTSLSSPSQKFSNSPSKATSPLQKSPQKGKNFVLKFRSGDAGNSVGLTPSTQGGLTPGSVTGRRPLGEDFKQFSDIEMIKRVKVVAERIIKSKKVFVIKGGCYRTIARGLRRRGWVAQNYKIATPTPDDGKQTRGRSQVKGSSDDESSGDDSDGDINGSESEEEYDEEDERQYRMLSYAVRNSEPHFIWTLSRRDVPYRSLKKDQLANHYSGTNCFTTKVGICQSIRSLPWFGDTDSRSFFPRCYLLANEDEREMFIDDYRFTAALSILKMLLEPSSTNGSTMTITSSSSPSPSLSRSTPSTPVRSLSRPVSRPSTPSVSSTTSRHCHVPDTVVDLAVRACEAFLASADHEDIDGSQTLLYAKLKEDEWSSLLKHYNTLAYDGGVMSCHSNLMNRAEELLLKVSQHCPQLTMDGTRNVWILKPGALSRGRGIVCLNRLDDILATCTLNQSVQMIQQKWVVQKYIEKPLLIYSTKFDIRQWFLVTDWNPLTMWMYQECYLRFSSQLYTLENLDVSVHLCNNSVQRYLSNAEERSDCLPFENMWDSDTFRAYLSDIGEKDKWESLIYPGMMQAIINVLKVNQEEMGDQKNSFELYGADFMITEDFVPWLVEVNCSPTMERNTSVTKRLCKQVMEDTLKVVIDRRADKDTDTGLFELAYKQAKHDLPQYVGLSLCVEGSAISPQKGRHRSRIPVSSFAGHMTSPAVINMNRSLVLGHSN